MVRRLGQERCEIFDLQGLEPASAGQIAMNLAIDSDRLHAEIEELAAITEAEPPVVTRILFTDADMKARAWMIERCKAAGLSVRQDAIGNTFARWNGSDPQAPAVGT